MARLLLWSWAQGVGVAIAASTRARRRATSAARCAMNRRFWVGFELELGLIQTQMAQKPMLRTEVYARALRASQKRERERMYGWARDASDEWAGRGRVWEWKAVVWGWRDL